MMASVAVPEPTSMPQFASTTEFGLPYRMPVYLGIRYMNQFIITAIRTLGGSRGESYVVEKRKDNLGKLV